MTRLLGLVPLFVALVLNNYAWAELCSDGRAHVADASLYSSHEGPLLVLEGLRLDEEINFHLHNLRLGDTLKDQDSKIVVKVRVNRIDFLPVAAEGSTKIASQIRGSKRIAEFGPFAYEDKPQNRFVHYYLHEEYKLQPSSLVPTAGLLPGFQVEVIEILSDGSERLLDSSLRYLIVPHTQSTRCHESVPSDTIVFAGEPFDIENEEKKEGRTLSTSFNIIVTKPTPKKADLHSH